MLSVAADSASLLISLYLLFLKPEILRAGIVPIRPKVHFTGVTAGAKDEGEKVDTIVKTIVSVLAIHHEATEDVHNFQHDEHCFPSFDQVRNQFRVLQLDELSARRWDSDVFLVDIDGYLANAKSRPT